MLLAPRRSLRLQRRQHAGLVNGPPGLTRPSASMRSQTPSTMSLAMSGVARAERRSYGSGTLRRPSSSTSVKRSVVNRASGTPLRWMTVLTPTVVPCVKYAMDCGLTPKTGVQLFDTLHHLTAGRVRPR